MRSAFGLDRLSEDMREEMVVFEESHYIQE